MTRFEVLAIGDELLDGRVADTNTLRLAVALEPWGGRLSRRTTITDDVSVIAGSAREIAARGTGVCIVSGGLGPTTDDVTADAFAALCGVATHRVPEQVIRITERLAKRGVAEVSESHLRQADIPAGADALENSVGTALGFIATFGATRFVCLPGVPAEYDAMLAAALPGLLGAPGADRVTAKLRVFGRMEAQVNEDLAELTERFPEVRVGYRAHLPEIHLSFKGPPAATQGAQVWARAKLGDAVFSTDEDMAAVVVDALRARGQTLAAAESCTGGLVAAGVVAVPGASDVFAGGVVAYSNAVKTSALGVSADVLAASGAVSESVVRAMAEGVREKLGSTWGISVSGVAGPGGGTPEKPVGTVWFAVAGPDGTQAFVVRYPYGRDAVRRVAAHALLDALRLRLVTSAAA